jgi:hypothetical protein
MKRTETGQMDGFRPPREDINSPDLYIPGKMATGGDDVGVETNRDPFLVTVMAVVTYVLMCGLVAGRQGS